jgi:uncharacterized protein (TIGR02300 family)
MENNLGNKHVCNHCGCKFYDLDKAKPICPKCGASQEENQKGKKKLKEADMKS